MNPILFVMPFAVAGDVTRREQATIETQILGATPFPTYGIFGKIAAGLFVPIGAGDVASAVYGLLVRPFPTQGANASDPLGVSVPKTSGLADVLRRGYAGVQVNAGAPAVNGTVYIRVATPSGAKVIGGIEAVSDTTNTIAVTGCGFTGNADANGLAELWFNI